MARKYNLDKVSNYLLTETKLSADECHKVLDVVEEQFSQNIRQQKKMNWPRNHKETEDFRKCSKKIELLNNKYLAYPQR